MSNTPFKIRHVPRWWPDQESPPPFTCEAIATLDDVQELARLRKVSGAVPAWLILWAVLRRRNKNGRLGLVVLEACGVRPELLERDIHELHFPIGSGEPDLDFSVIHQVALGANVEAAALAHDWVGTEHLVLALFNNGEQVRKFFQAHRVTREAFTANLLALLGS
jgi:hypothetical protein